MKSFIHFLLLSALFIGTNLQAQTFYADYDPSPGNQVYFGGFSRILPLQDGNYIAMSGTYEKVVAKLNANMEIVWAYKVDLPGSQTTFGLYDITISNDNKILVLGFGNNLSIVLKMDLDGNVIWKKDVESHYATCGFYLNGKQILNAHDNGFFIVGGTSDAQSMLLRMDENGNAVWAKVYDDVDYSGNARFNYGIQEGPTSYLFQSTMRSASFFRIDDNGAILSQTHYENPQSTFPKLMVKASNGDYYSAGYTIDSLTNYTHQILMRLDPNGGLVWQKKIVVDSVMRMYEPYSVFQLPNNEICILGYLSNVNYAGRRIQISRFDMQGNHLGSTLGWDGGSEYVYGGTYHAGYILLAGISLANRNLIARVDLNGYGMCTNAPINMIVTDITSTATSSNDQIVVNNMPTTITNSTWTVTPYTYTRTVMCGTTIVGMEDEAAGLFSVSPLPSFDDCYLHHPNVETACIRLVDLNGKQVWKGTAASGATKTFIPRNHLPAGMYFVQFESSDFQSAQRVVFQ